MIHERSRGIPRTISVLCDNALLTAFAIGQRPVTSRVVTEVCGDFDLAAPPVAADSVASNERPAPAVGIAAENRRLLSVQADGTSAPHASGSQTPKTGTFGAFNLRRKFRIFG